MLAPLFLSAKAAEKDQRRQNCRREGVASNGAIWPDFPGDSNRRTVAPEPTHSFPCLASGNALLTRALRGDEPKVTVFQANSSLKCQNRLIFQGEALQGPKRLWKT